MRLVLQSPILRRDAVERIAAACGALHVESIAAGAVRLTNVRGERAAVARVRDLALAACVDFAFIPDALRLTDFRLLVMDMDSTLITIECIDEIADFCGMKAEVAAITEAAMRGEIADYKSSLRQRVALLRGLDESVLQRVYEERLRLSPGAERMLDGVRQAGLKTLLVSGGFTYFTERLKARLGLDFVRSNMLAVKGGRLTGELVGDIVDASGKSQAVAAICAQIGISPDRAIVLGDGANDLAMMALAGISVAYRAKPVVRAQTTYALNFCGLDGMLNWFDDAVGN